MNDANLCLISYTFFFLPGSVKATATELKFVHWLVTSQQLIINARCAIIEVSKMDTQTHTLIFYAKSIRPPTE